MSDTHNNSDEGAYTDEHGTPAEVAEEPTSTHPDDEGEYTDEHGAEREPGTEDGHA